MERRAFLQVAGTAGAGLVIGFRIPDRPGHGMALARGAIDKYRR